MGVDPTTQDLLIVGRDLVDADPVLEGVRRRLYVRRGSVFWDASFGSRLHELLTAKVTARLAVLIEDRVREALAPMVTTGAISIQGFEHERAGDRWHTAIALRDSGQRAVAFDLFFPVAP